MDKPFSVAFESGSQLETIGEHVFENSKITSIEIPSSVTEIRNNCFAECTNLTNVTFDPDSQLKKLGPFLFENSKIEKILIPSSVTEIGIGCFSYCKNLTNVTFKPGSLLKKLRDSVFVFTAIKSIEIPSLVTEISNGCFSSCYYLTKVSFKPDSLLKKIGQGAFAYSTIKSIEIPSSVTVIGYVCFSNCKNLTNVTFKPNSQLKTLSPDAFIGSSVDSIILPVGVDFKSDTGKIEVSHYPVYKTEDNSVIIYNYIKKLTKDIVDFDELDEPFSVTFELGSQLEIIEEEVFENSKITSIEIPPSVIMICNYCFFGCEYLTEVAFERDSLLKTLGEYVFTNSVITSIKIPASVTVINKRCFDHCNDLTDVTFEAGSLLKTLGERVFNNSGIKSIKIPHSVTEIGNGCFRYCQHLTKVTFEQDSLLKTFEQRAFSNSGIKEIKIPPSVTKIDKNCFTNCKDLTKVTFEPDSQLEILHQSAFDGSNVKQLKLPLVVDFPPGTMDVTYYPVHLKNHIRKIEFYKPNNNYNVTYTISTNSNSTFHTLFSSLYTQGTQYFENIILSLNDRTIIRETDSTTNLDVINHGGFTKEFFQNIIDSIFYNVKSGSLEEKLYQLNMSEQKNELKKNIEQIIPRGDLSEEEWLITTINKLLPGKEKEKEKETNYNNLKQLNGYLESIIILNESNINSYTPALLIKQVIKKLSTHPIIVSEYEYQRTKETNAETTVFRFIYPNVNYKLPDYAQQTSIKLFYYNLGLLIGRILISNYKFSIPFDNNTICLILIQHLNKQNFQEIRDIIKENEPEKYFNIIDNSEEANDYKKLKDPETNKLIDDEYIFNRIMSIMLCVDENFNTIKTNLCEQDYKKKLPFFMVNLDEYKTLISYDNEHVFNHMNQSPFNIIKEEIDKEPIIKNIMKEYNIKNNNDNLINKFYQGIITILQTKKDFTFGKLMKQIERDPYQKDNLLKDLNDYLIKIPEISACLKHLIQYITLLNMDDNNDKKTLLKFYKNITGIASYKKITILANYAVKIGMHTCMDQLDIPRNEFYLHKNVEYNEDIKSYLMVGLIND